MHQQPRGRGLAAARLSHHAERLAFRHTEADAIHRLDPGIDEPKRAAQREMLAQTVDDQQRLVRPATVAHARTSIAVRRLSLSRLKLTEAAKIITPGSTAFTGAT